MEPCVTCGNADPVVPVPTTGCECVTPGGGSLREVRLLAPTRHEYEYWEANDPLIPEGVICIVKDRLFDGSREYIISNSDTDKFSDLTPMAGAPLSRTGTANHSPLAAEGKSTLDPSWLPDATSNAKGAVMTSTTGAAGKVPVAGNDGKLDPSWYDAYTLPAATDSVLGGVMTSLTGASGKVPIAGSNGTLDPSWLPEATSTALGAVKASTTKAANNVVKADSNGGLDGWKDAIIDAIIADDGSGGLVTDDNGNLTVDFSQMPTDKFEDLLKSLKMLVPLTSNYSLYVDTNNAAAADTIEDGRGTQAKPFKTIQAAVNFLTSTYAIGPYTARIRVVAGTYEEYLSLPNYSRTSGGIRIITDSDQQDVVLLAPQSPTHGGVGTPVSCEGGSWGLYHLTCQRTEHETTESSYTPSCFSVEGPGELGIHGCKAIQKMPSGGTLPTGTDPVSGLTYKNYNVRVFEASLGGKLHLYNDSLPTVISVEKPSSGTPSVTVFHVNRGSTLVLHRSSSAGDYEFSGTCDTCLVLSGRSTMTYQSSGSYPNFTVPSGETFTGKSFELSSGATGIAGFSSSYFPGDEAGTVDPATYCWYNGSENA